MNINQFTETNCSIHELINMNSLFTSNCSKTVILRKSRKVIIYIFYNIKYSLIKYIENLIAIKLQKVVERRLELIEMVEF